MEKSYSGRICKFNRYFPENVKPLGAVANKLFECVWLFCAAGADRTAIL